MAFDDYKILITLHALFSASLHTALSNNKNLTSVMQYGIRSTHRRDDIFNFLQSKIYDTKNINVLVLCETNCLKIIIHEVGSLNFFVYFYFWGSLKTRHHLDVYVCIHQFEYIEGNEMG